MKKRFLVFLLVAIVSFGMVFAANNETTGNYEDIGPSGANGPNLLVNWKFDDAIEKYKVGFSANQPATGLDSELNTITDATTEINIGEKGGNKADTFIGIATVYPYWDVYSNKSLIISLKADGPLMTNGGQENTYNTDKINWKATWTATTVQAETGTVLANGNVQTLGKIDNEFGDPSAYTDPKPIFTQAGGEYRKTGKTGFVKVDIETQNTRAEGIKDTDNAKVSGDYVATMSLIIKTV